MEIKERKLHRVVVTAVIIKEGKFLITQRSKDRRAYPLLWTVPGGGMEVDDYINTEKTNEDCWYFSAEKTLKREVREEVNLEVDNLKYLLDLTFIRPNGVPAFVLSYYCNYKSGEVELNDENIDYKWVSYEEAKDYELVPGLLGEIEMVDKILKGEKDVKYIC